MRRRPAFTTVLALTLALGIRADTAIFRVVDTVLVRPLPYADANRLVMVWEDAAHVGFSRNASAPATWVGWRQQNSLARLALV